MMSVHKRSGKWQVRYRDGGVGRSRTFTLKADAVAFDRQVLHEKETRGMVLVDRGKIELDRFFALYWDNKAAGWSTNTRNTYRSYYQRWIRPTIGRRELRTFEPRVIVEWQRYVEAKGITGPTLKKVMTMLSGMFTHAVLVGEMPYNPMREIRIPQETRKLPPEPLSPVEIESVRSLLDPRDATVASVLGYMGLRPVELGNLQWEDVHSGDRALIHESKRDRERPGLILPPVAQDLRQWQLESGGRQGRVFPGFDLHNWRNRKWKPAFEEAGVEGRDIPRRLRSSFVSLLLADPSYSLFEVAMFAGHSLDVMSKHYAGLINQYQGKNIRAEDEIVKARQGRIAA
jgi:integrase